jgi:hypothetical protein
MERNESVTILDPRSNRDNGLEAFAPHLQAMGLSADLLSPVVTLTPRAPWVDGKAILTLQHTYNGGWGLDTEYDIADWSGPQSVYPAYTLRVRFIDLAPALYLVAFELASGWAFGSNPEYWLQTSFGMPQKVSFTPGQTQYVATLIPVGEPGHVSESITLQTFDVAQFAFRRVSLVNVFG